MKIVSYFVLSKSVWNNNSKAEAANQVSTVHRYDFMS